MQRVACDVIAMRREVRKIGKLEDWKIVRLENCKIVEDVGKLKGCKVVRL